MAPEAVLLQRQRGEAQNDPREHRDQEEADEVDGRQVAEEPPPEDGRDAEHLEDRPEELEQQEVGHRPQAEHAVAPVPGDATVPPEGLAEPPVPAPALP